MPRVMVVFCILFVVCPVVMRAQDSIAISDFRYPETRAIDWKGGLTGFLDAGASEQNPLRIYNPFPLSGSTTRSSSRVSLNSTFLYFHSKEDHDQTFMLSTYGSFGANGGESETNDSGVTRQQREEKYTDWNGQLNAQWTYLQYCSVDGFHFLGSGSLSYTGSYTRDNSSTNLLSGSSGFEDIYHSYDLRFKGSLGIGFGRIRDGTFVFRAVRVIERLREDGVITTPLSRAQMLSLVDRVAHRREYTTNFERYQKYFVEDIVEELVASGVVSPQALKPYSALRVAESFNEDIQSRFFGWRIYYAFDDTHTQSLADRDERTSTITPFSYHNFSNDWEYLHEFGAEIGNPISLNTHLHSDVKIELPVHDMNTRFQMNTEFSLIHQLGEKLELIVEYQYSRRVSDAYLIKGNEYGIQRTHTIQGNFVYFLEDKVRFSSRLTYNWMNSDSYSNSISLREFISSSGFTLSFGINYNII